MTLKEEFSIEMGSSADLFSDEQYIDWLESKYEQMQNKDPKPFTKAVELLRDLADLQNGPPLERHRKEWEETMEQVYAALYKWEAPK